jgi:hypothetical protein
MIIEDGWQGGRYDATAVQRRAAVAQMTRWCTVGAMSEAEDISAPEGWNASGQECKVLWDTEEWRKVESGVAHIRTPRWKRGTSERDEVLLTWVLLKHKRTGVLLLRVASHLPAHLADPHQKAANAAALKQLGKIVSTLAGKTGADEVSVTLDLNRDLRLKRNQDLVRRYLRGTGLHLVVPPRGTFGQRKIDCFIVSTGLYTRHMFEPRKGFDHQGWWLRYHGEAR